MNTKRNLAQICMLAAALSPGFISKAQQPTVTKVATGENDTLFIKSDGSLWGMGANTYGELGDGTNSPSLYPEQIVVSASNWSTHYTVPSGTEKVPCDG